MANPSGMTAEQHNLCKGMGLDWQNIDWMKIGEALRLLAIIVSQFWKNSGDVRKGLQALGCPDEHVDHACRCCEAGKLALEAAQVSFECCGDMCQQTP